MRFKKGILLFAAIILCAASAFASPAKDEDFGIWSQNDIEAKIREKWKVRAGEEIRFREHGGIQYFDSHVGASYQVFSHLLAGAEYLQVRQTKTQGKKDLWFWESRPRIYGTLQQKIKGFSLDDRNMLEFRFKETYDDTVRYRNMVTLTAPWKWTPLEIQPYAANELFFETDRNGLVEDRLYSGVKLHFWKPFYGAFFYLRQFQKNSQAVWKESNILGFGAKVSV